MIMYNGRTIDITAIRANPGRWETFDVYAVDRDEKENSQWAPLDWIMKGFYARAVRRQIARLDGPGWLRRIDEAEEKRRRWTTEYSA